MLKKYLFLRIVALVMWVGAAVAVHAEDQYEQPPIRYSATKPHDALAAVQARLAKGELTLDGSDREVLTALLRELKIPVESQVTVFSRTSLQRDRIRPSRPRAIYFSDTSYVGWVPSGLIEVASIDPRLGPIFYAFDP